MAPSKRPPPPRPLPQTVFRPAVPAGRQGGTNGYPQHQRGYVLRLCCDAGWNFLELQYQHHAAVAAAAGAEFPCKETVQKWANRMRTFGHSRAFVKQGNNRSTVVRGEALIRLSMWKRMYPRATAHETNAFLWNSSPNLHGQRRFYSQSQITHAEDKLGLSLKVSATTARQAMLPINILKRRNFWNLPYPFGIANIARQDLIDLDEAAVFLETVNRSRGKSYIGTRCREVGLYGHSAKYTLMMAISGDQNDGMRHLLMEQRAGTGNAEFAAFIQDVLNIIGPGNAFRRRCFIMDNLVSHHSAVIRQMIVNAGHRLVFRAPYYPVDGPIEFVFNTVEQKLTDYQYTIVEGNGLRQAVQTIVAGMNRFDDYFVHCGY